MISAWQLALLHYAVYQTFGSRKVTINGQQQLLSDSIWAAIMAVLGVYHGQG